jgi:hypothetical protein
LRHPTLALGDHDGAQRVQRHRELIVNHQIIELGVVRQFVQRRRHALFDDLGAILAAPRKTLAQGLPGWRQNENRRAVRPQCPHLASTLPVDFQDHIPPGLQLGHDCGATGTVAVAEYLSLFQERVLGDHPCKGVGGHEMVVDAIALAGTMRSSGVGNRDDDIRRGFHQAFDQAGFARSGGGGDDVQFTN